MRRDCLCALLFAFALAVQALAPAAARMAMGAASQSACSTASVRAAATDEAQPAGRSHGVPEICDFCALCCEGGTAPPTPPRGAAVCAAAIPASVPGWTVADDESAPSRHDHLIRARAPPVFS
jgi:hypothetical protein